MVPRPRCVDVTRCGASTFFGKVSKTGQKLRWKSLEVVPYPDLPWRLHDHLLVCGCRLSIHQHPLL